MIGNDCILIEQNVDVFLDCLLQKDLGESWESPTAGKLKTILRLYKSFAELARYVLI